MRKLSSTRVVLIGALVLIAVLILSAFMVVQGTPEFTDSGAPGWSRGKLIGQASLVNPVALLPDPQGGAHLVWAAGDPPNHQQLNYARLNADGDVLLSRPLVLPQSAHEPQAQPESPTLFRAPGGSLNLFYMARGSEDLQPLERALYLARVDGAGNVVETARVSLPQHAVKTYTVAQSQGVYQVFYSADDTAPGVFWSCYTADPRLAGCAPALQPQLPLGTLNETATRPAAHADEQGQMHLAWFTAPAGTGSGAYRTELYYTLSDPGGHALQPVKLTTFEYESGVELKQPQIAFDGTHTTIAWVQDKRGGRGAINSQAFYVSFPTGQPATADEPLRLSLPATGKVKYQSRPGEVLSALAPAAGGASNYVNDLQLLSGPQVVGVALLGLQDKQRAPVQVAAFALAQGRPLGFQLVNNSLTPANQPGIALDAGGHLQLVWLDGEPNDRYAVRYASTDTRLVARWGQLDVRDVAARVSNFVWFELSFLPWIILSVPWLFLPLAVLIVRTVIASDESLASRGTRIALVLAIAVHLVVKTVLLPQLPDDWPLPERIAFMAVLPVLGLAAMALYLRRERYASPLLAYLVFAAVDVLLALFVWWPIATA